LTATTIHRNRAGRSSFPDGLFVAPFLPTIRQPPDGNDGIGQRLADDGCVGNSLIMGRLFAFLSPG
jgi:hypothetical protein